MNIILFGPPGAGKGTQADNLVKEFKLIKVSTGELLRNEIKKKSSLGIEIENKINQGHLASDKIMNNLIEKVLSNKIYFNRIIFDGFPRNLEQAKNLQILMNKYKQKISCVLNLKVEKEIIIKRILGRQICSKCGLTFNEFFNPSTKEKHKCDPNYLQKRSDDNEKTAKNRFETYEKETLPIFNHYKDLKLLHEIDGMGDIPKIYKEICQIIRSLET